MKITLSTGRGEAPTPLAAFDAALRDAGIANYNLLCLSSVIPPGTTIVRAKHQAEGDEYGHRLYLVMARESVAEPGQTAWAGLGWTQTADDGRGLFVELHGTDRADVEHRIHATLQSMIASRPFSYGPIQSEIAGITCQDQPVCALVVAVYQSEGWNQ